MKRIFLFVGSALSLIMSFLPLIAMAVVDVVLLVEVELVLLEVEELEVLVVELLVVEVLVVVQIAGDGHLPALPAAKSAATSEAARARPMISTSSMTPFHVRGKLAPRVSGPVAPMTQGIDEL